MYSAKPRFPQPLRQKQTPSSLTSVENDTYEVQRMIFQGPSKPLLNQIDHLSLSPGPGETLVQITMSTICGSDLHTFEGRRDGTPPSVLGHEGVGIVIATGPGANDSLIGKRVTWTLVDTCGCCEPCTSWDLPQKCDNLFKYGHSSVTVGQGLNGCFASHIMLRKGTHIVPLPDALSDVEAVPANCALATMVAVVDPLLKGQRTPRKVLIQGAGLLGIYGATLLKNAGVKNVYVTDVFPGRLDLAQNFGSKTIDSSDLNTIRDGSFDAIIEVAGNSVIIPEGLRVLRPGGTYVWAGMVHDETPLDFLGVDIVRGCATIIGVHNYAPRHLEEGIQFLTRNADQFPWNQLVSSPLKLSQLNEAFELAQTRKWHRVSVIPDYAEFVTKPPPN
ncbi:MAG TPA: dehydrogenase [Verrucomicrobiales bacterium]|nr:dehydrogenase [Verrucomicrobiales bacterium]HCN80152.1 dehydrogenase [Verrucomicrobiales bacterium]|tara:strand:- start:1129 stop:2295 length:1167 start_codon:yes stop_codon:yes gene_type:complete